VFRCVFHIDPVNQKLPDLVAGKVRILFLDALNGLLEIQAFRIRPDEFALLGVELHVLHQNREDVGLLHGLHTLRRVHPLKEPFEEGIIHENTVFPDVLYAACP